MGHKKEIDFDVLKRIEERINKMSKGHKLIAQYILLHYDKATFMTASKLGDIVGVSESTVVRFACNLGFSGYPMLQRALQEIVKNKLTTLQRVDITNQRLKNGDIIESVMNIDIDKIRNSIADVDRDSFFAAVDAISNAANIYILGSRSSYALGQFMGYYFNFMFKNVHIISGNSAAGIFDNLVKLDSNDVFIAIGFPRYSVNTVKAAKFAMQKGAKTIAITDRENSPVGEYADYKLIARSDVISIVDTLVAPLSLINALITALGVSNEQKVSRSLEELEEIWKEYEVYAQKSGDILD